MLGMSNEYIDEVKRMHGPGTHGPGMGKQVACTKDLGMNACSA